MHIRPPAQTSCAVLRITHRGQTCLVTALVDSGNLLRDDVTGLPVVVLSRRAASHLAPWAAAGQLIPGARYLPMRTAAGPACMLVFRPDSIRLDTPSGRRELKAVVGIAPDAHARFSALAPPCLLTEQIKEGWTYEHDV